MSAVSMRTTTVKYQTKPQAAVQYEIALLSGALVYNPNQSEEIKGKLEWRVYKIEGDQRLPMSNKQEGMTCRCGYSDTPDNTPGVNTTDNVTFNDDGAAQVAYNSDSTKQFTIVYGSVAGNVFTQLARLDVPVNVVGKDSTPTLSIHLDNQYDTMLCYYHGGNAVLYGNKPVTNIKVMYGGDDVTTKLESNVTATANSASFKGEWLTQNVQYRVNSINADTVVTFSVTYKGQTATAAMTVRLQDGGNKYNIRLSTSTIAYNVSTGAMTDDEVEVEVWMENETGSSSLTSIPQGMALTYKVNEENEVDISEAFAGTYTLSVGSEVRKITLTLSHEQEGVLDTQSVSVIEVENGKNGENGENGKDASFIDFDNNNATILYNSITGTYVTESYPVSNISVVEDGVDISETAEIKIEAHGLFARVKGRGSNIPLTNGTNATLATGKGGIISVTVESVDSTGYVLAKYIDSAGITHTTRFNVSRSVGRYAVEIITTPTQISYNQTTGVASSSTITTTLNVIDIYGNRTTGATFSTFGAMKWRYVGATEWTAPTSQSITKLEITTPDFTKTGVEFAFFDGSNNQLDYETVPFSSVTNGGDAYLVNVASMNVAVVLTSISYGTPTGDATNVVYMTKNNVVLSSGVEYNVPGDNGDEHTFASDSDTPIDISYNGWVFNYSYQEGRLKSSLVRVNEGSPTSVHIPIDVIYPTDNITRTVMISYSAIQKGPAGRSYKPNTPELYDPTKKYKWTDEYRDFIYYAFEDSEGKVSYHQYGVKDYGKELANTPPTAKDGDTNWEYVSEYKSIIVNCLFGTNAVLGGMVFTADTQTSVKETNGEANIIINGSTGKLTANDAIIRGEINATSGVFQNVKITNNCHIEPETKDGEGWFMRGGNDRAAAWWLGYSGKLTGQFTMTTVYNNGSNHPPTASLSFNTPNIQGGTSDGLTLISAYSNINTPLANFSHAKGMMVRICPSEGVGMTFIDNVGNANPIAFNGKGHGALNGVMQGYKLNVMSSGLINISNGNTVYCNGNGTNLILPTRKNCRNVLGATGAFALDLTIIAASGASNFRVYGKYHNSTTDCYLLNNDHGDNWFATMSQGDVLTLKLIYTGTSFYAYIVNLQN